MKNLLNIFIEPGKVFSHIKEKDDWWIPFLVVIAVTLIYTYITTPAVTRLIGQRMAELGVDRAPGGNFMFVRYIAGPIFVLMAWAVFSFIMWIAGSAVGGDWNFLKALDLYAYTSVVAAVKQVLSMVVIKLRGIENIMTFKDLHVSTGLDLFFTPQNPRLYAVLSSVDIFSIWMFTLIAFGVSDIAGISREKSIGVAVLTFIVSVGFSVLTAGRGAGF